MKSWRRFRCLLAVAPLWAAACEPSNRVPAGPPKLVEVLALDPMTVNPDASGAATVQDGTAVYPVTPITLIFDRLLDPDAIETVVPDPVTGMDTFKVNLGIATIQSPVATVAQDGMAFTVDYTPNGDSKFALVFSKGPALMLNVLNGLPAASLVTVFLDPNKVRSRDQMHPFVVATDGLTAPAPTPTAAGVAAATFQTEPVTATITLPPPPDPMAEPLPPPTAAPDYVVPVVFNVVPPMDADTHIQVTGTSSGVPIAALGATVAADPTNRLGFTVSPPAGGWPVGAVVTVTVDATFADPYGVALGTPATASFTVVQP